MKKYTYLIFFGIFNTLGYFGFFTTWYTVIFRMPFNNKLNNLLLMNDERYIDLTKKSREYFINSERPYPHETIKHDIDKYLNSFV